MTAAALANTSTKMALFVDIWLNCHSTLRHLKAFKKDQSTPEMKQLKVKV
jgi:hypothetical protein